MQLTSHAYNESGLLALISSNVAHEGVLRADFFAVPDPVSVQAVAYPLRTGYQSFEQVPTHDESFPIAPYTRWLCGEEHLTHFVRQAAAHDFDVMQLPASLDTQPAIQEGLVAYQQLLGVSGAATHDLSERARDVSGRVYKSLESYVSDDFFALTRYLRDSVEQEEPLRKWEMELLGTYATNDAVPESVLVSGLADMGLCLDDHLHDVLVRERAQEGVNRQIGAYRVAKELYKAAQSQLYPEP